MSDPLLARVTASWEGARVGGRMYETLEGGSRGADGAHGGGGGCSERSAAGAGVRLLFPGRPAAQRGSACGVEQRSGRSRVAYLVYPAHHAPSGLVQPGRRVCAKHWERRLSERESRYHPYMWIFRREEQPLWLLIRRQVVLVESGIDAYVGKRGWGPWSHLQAGTQAAVASITRPGRR